MTAPVEKNEVYTLEIIDIGTNGEGIAKIDDFVIFIPDAVTGDLVDVKMLKVKKNMAYGKVIQMVRPSENRSETLCPITGKCGGCQLQHINYESQLEWKRKKVYNAITRIGGIKDVQVEPTLGMENPYYYRNKAQYPIRKIGDEIQIGFFASRSHRVIDWDRCVIQDARCEEIIKAVKAFLQEENISIYDETSHKGLVRHLIIKTAYYTKEIMVALVINGNKLPKSEKLIAKLEVIPEIKSLLINQNKRQTNVILGDEVEVLKGKDYIIDQIGDLSFKISLLSFFQVNPLQTKVLYDKALEYAELTGEETVWDAYCGIGSISLFLAQKAKKVYGVEIVEPAIVNARENAALNQVSNVEFFVGKAEEVIPEEYQQGIVADTIVVDPPRKGCDTKLLDTLVEMSPKKIVYVSCDPATLGRDLGYLVERGYCVEKVQPVDMFAHSTHVETVVLMTKVEK